MKLAEKLGVEQRASVRVRYPRVTEVCRLPQIAFLDYKFIVYNISTGGCALLDSDEVLGPQVGHEIQLTLTWPDGVERVNARIVSRVDHRRHIQFLNLAPARIKQLANSMSAGVRGLSMRRHALSSLQGPSMEANELWSSPAGDSLVLETSVHRLAQIVEKIYKKQGTVPFRSILKAIHMLHQGNFFENSHELFLNKYLRSWMEPRKQLWAWSWRFSQRLLTERQSPTAYYLLSLAILVTALCAFQVTPSSPLDTIQVWMDSEPLYALLFKLLVASSLIQTARYFIRGIQLLLLTGKVYNLSLRIGPWGVHLHIGNEANDLFENRLYTVMFHVSQIFLGWSLLFCASFLLPEGWLEPIFIVVSLLSFWEINTFVPSEGLKLIQSLMVPIDGELTSWHFDETAPQYGAETRLRRDEDFARICAIWGTFWLVLSFAFLHQVAVVFGPRVLNQVTHLNAQSALSLVCLEVWLSALFYVVQCFVETVVASMLSPWLKALRGHIKSYRLGQLVPIDGDTLIATIEGLPLFSHFHPQSLKRILEHSKVLEYRSGRLIVRENDVSRELFVLLSGEVEISRRTGSTHEWLIELSAISIFGEAALLSDAPRAADVVAKSQATVLHVPVMVLRKLAEETHVIRQIEDFRNAILVNQFFASSPVFRSLSANAIEFLSNRGTLEYFDKEQLVFSQGDTGDSIYLVLRGSVRVVVHGTFVKDVEQGNFFGEIALIANIPRTATIVTAEPSVFFKVSADAFWEILVQHIDVGVFIETVSETRLREDLKIIPNFKATGSDAK
ncbi:unnamed protein product [Sphagnum balticum]